MAELMAKAGDGDFLRTVAEAVVQSLMEADVDGLMALAASTEGKREVVGLHLSPSETKTFWAIFLRSLLKRGLRLDAALRPLPPGIAFGGGSSWSSRTPMGD